MYVLYIPVFLFTSSLAIYCLHIMLALSLLRDLPASDSLSLDAPSSSARAEKLAEGGLPC